jgi:hypothetical protein
LIPPIFFAQFFNFRALFLYSLHATIFSVYLALALKFEQQVIEIKRIMNFKLLLAYDIRSQRTEDYYQFIMGEFLPRVQALGLIMTEGWQTLYGDYPSRLLGFAARDDKTLQHVIQSDEWDSIETKLGEFVANYERRLVKAKPGFQFFIPYYRRQNRG